MNARVDVLAVMDRAVEFAAGGADRSDLREARAAVAELIEVGKRFDALYQPDGPISHWDREPDDRASFGVNSATITLGDFRRLRAALARINKDPDHGL